jgi:HSP20 family molecular chaperone IbpA
MSLFNTIVPTFNRSLARRGASAATESQAVQPAYEVKETADAYGLTVYLPGVTKEGLELTAEEGTFIVRGKRAWKQPEGWTALYRESADVPFELLLTHDNTIDAEKIHAELKDGVLRVSLPKTEAVKPRKIAVS